MNIRASTVVTIFLSITLGLFGSVDMAFGQTDPATSFKRYSSAAPNPSGEISPSRLRALDLYKRLVGVRVAIDDPILNGMEAAIAAGNLLGAAQIATQQSGFYNLTVRDMAAKMSTREETVKADLNDFVATFVGATRDDLDARTLLTGRYFYMGTEGVSVAQDLAADVVASNNHYAALQNNSYDLKAVLRRVESQSIRNSAGNLVANPDAAGLITTRAFMAAHAIAGTNRRLVEYSFRQFTCNPIEKWADASSADIFVGRDIDRFPGGESAKYQTNCKACHANMDAFRGAFAKYDFADQIIKYSAFFPAGDAANQMRQAPVGISTKLNQNNDVFPGGYRTTSDQWFNYAVSTANQRLFRWRGSGASGGAGVNSFANAIAQSEAFSDCMVKRVFEEVCRREVAAFELNYVRSMAVRFEANGYRLKSLFENIAISPECLGK